LAPDSDSDAPEIPETPDCPEPMETESTPKPVPTLMVPRPEHELAISTNTNSSIEISKSIEAGPELNKTAEQFLKRSAPCVVKLQRIDLPVMGRSKEKPRRRKLKPPETSFLYPAKNQPAPTQPAKEIAKNDSFVFIDESPKNAHNVTVDSEGQKRKPPPSVANFKPTRRSTRKRSFVNDSTADAKPDGVPRRGRRTVRLSGDLWNVSTRVTPRSKSREKRRQHARGFDPLMHTPSRRKLPPKRSEISTRPIPPMDDAVNISTRGKNRKTNAPIIKPPLIPNVASDNKDIPGPEIQAEHSSAQAVKPISKPPSTRDTKSSRRLTRSSASPIDQIPPIGTKPPNQPTRNIPPFSSGAKSSRRITRGGTGSIVPLVNSKPPPRSLRTSVIGGSINPSKQPSTRPRTKQREKADSSADFDAHMGDFCSPIKKSDFKIPERRKTAANRTANRIAQSRRSCLSQSRRGDVSLLEGTCALSRRRFSTAFFMKQVQQRIPVSRDETVSFDATEDRKYALEQLGQDKPCTLNQFITK